MTRVFHVYLESYSIRQTINSLCTNTKKIWIFYLFCNFLIHIFIYSIVILALFWTSHILSFIFPLMCLSSLKCALQLRLMLYHFNKLEVLSNVTPWENILHIKVTQIQTVEVAIHFTHLFCPDSSSTCSKYKRTIQNQFHFHSSPT